MPLTPLAGSVETLRLESRCLRGNLLGDPTEREVHVYLPPDYESSNARYPVLVVLPGFGSLSRALLRKDPFKESLVECFDRMLRGKGCPPAVLVMPEACTRYGGSQFVDSPVTGNHQTFLVEEVLPAVDARFRTVAERSGRGAVGVSSGGFGALRLALDRPDSIACAGSIAGDAAFEISLRPMIPKVAAALLSHGGLADFFSAIDERGPSSNDYDPLFFLAAAQAYAPEPDAPFPHLALPFDPLTAELDPGVWARYVEEDPLERIATSMNAQKMIQGIVLDVGMADEYGLQFAARQLHAAFQVAGIPATLTEFEGGHRGAGRRMEVVLPKLLTCLAAA